MPAIARIRRQFVHHYGDSEFRGLLVELSPQDGSCTFMGADNQPRTLWLRHLADLRDEPDAAGSEPVDYLVMARKRGWNGR